MRNTGPTLLERRVNVLFAGEGGIRGYVGRAREQGLTAEQIALTLSVRYGRSITGRTIYNWINRWRREEAAGPRQDQQEVAIVNDASGEGRGAGTGGPDPDGPAAPRAPVPQRRRAPRPGPGGHAHHGVRGEPDHEVAVTGGTT